jgi:hypothetical protein
LPNLSNWGSAFAVKGATIAIAAMKMPFMFSSLIR